MRSLKTKKKNGTKARSLSKIMELFNPPRHKSISRLIPIAELDDELGVFRTTEGQLFDIYSITTSDLLSCSSDDFNFLVALWEIFYRKFPFDMKLVSLNAPTDTRIQQQYIQTDSANIISFLENCHLTLAEEASFPVHLTEQLAGQSNLRPAPHIQITWQLI